MVIARLILDSRFSDKPSRCFLTQHHVDMQWWLYTSIVYRRHFWRHSQGSAALRMSCGVVFEWSSAVCDIRMTKWMLRVILYQATPSQKEGYKTPKIPPVFLISSLDVDLKPNLYCCKIIEVSTCRSHQESSFPEFKGTCTGNTYKSPK